MAQRGKHFTFGSPGMAGPLSASPSSWGKGVLLGLVLVFSTLMLIDFISPQQCALDHLGAINYLSLNVGGFSVFIKWNPYSCR
jgi:hypothetical protein